MVEPSRLKILAEEVAGLSRVPSGSCVVALSGGPDSAVCAWVALRSARQVRAVHVDHGLPDSPRLRKAAIAIAAKLDVHLDVVEVALDPGPSPEDVARRARYRALEQGLGPGETLLTGHTKSDQAETVLGNFVRGAGLDGLVGIPVERNRIARPLLEVTRAQTRELATLLGLPWMEDPANLEEGPRRNLLRRTIIPLLEETLNPSLEESLARGARVVSVERELADRIADRVPWTAGGGVVSLPAPLLATLPGAVASRVIRRALREVAGQYAGDSRDVDLVMGIASGTVQRAVLTGGVRAERDRALIVIGGNDQPSVPEAVDWAIPGTARFGPWVLEAWIDTVPPSAFPLSRFREVFDADAVSSPLLVTSVVTEDRISFTGGSKLVSQAFAEAGVPSGERSRRPVVRSSQGVLWVPGVRRADVGWVDSPTTRYLWVRATREDV